MWFTKLFSSTVNTMINSHVCALIVFVGIVGGGGPLINMGHRKLFSSTVITLVKPHVCARAAVVFRILPVN